MKSLGSIGSAQARRWDLRIAALAVLFAGAAGCEEDAKESGSVVDSSVDEPGDAGSADAGPSDVGEAPTVTVDQGSMRGKVVDKTRAFLGIPYGKPPVGALRFAPPEPAEAWTGTLDATAYGASCPQPSSTLGAMGKVDEDCLSLNVFSPLKPDGSLPVMAYIHGGAFVTGGSSQYDSEVLSQAGPVVVVTLNYRLGALGFFAHPTLDQARTDAPSGNDALRDQQLALRWIQDNIAAFGGDPGNVTVFGESAGSMSACLQMVSPSSKGLGHRFILQSGSCVGGLRVNTKANADALGVELANGLCAGEADAIACLRGKPASEIVGWGQDRGISGAGWAPVTNADDEMLPDAPAKLIADGRHNKAPLMLGTNKNEWGLFQLLGASPNVATVAALHAAIDTQYGAAAEAVKAHYTATDADANDVFVRIVTDTAFRCPTRTLARLAASQGSAVYLYSFEHGDAFHAYEIPYVFGKEKPLIGANLLAPLRDTMQVYWTTFAASGDPNSDGQTSWPAYSGDADQHMTLKATPEVSSALSSADCDFWDSILGG